MSRLEYRRLRARVGSQSVVARRLKIHVRTISKRECGELEIDGEAEMAIRWLALQSQLTAARVGR